jgi:hypothetical protein
MTDSMIELRQELSEAEFELRRAALVLSQTEMDIDRRLWTETDEDALTVAQAAFDRAWRAHEFASVALKMAEGEA